MIGFTVENTWMQDYLNHGWGNGYVAIPKNHHLYGVHYDSIDADVHRGLTFSKEITLAQDLKDDTLRGKSLRKKIPESKESYWVVGFHTNYLSDNENNCPKEYVEAEVERLLEQLKAIEIKE